MNTRLVAFHLLVLLLLCILAFILTTHYTSPMAGTITRWPGDPSSLPYYHAGHKCNATNPDSWGYGDCSRLIDCVYNDVSELQKSDVAIGCTILGLLPTIMAFAASRPNELLPQALISPHRAIATAAFSIGIPITIFQDLRPMRRGFQPVLAETVRTWWIPLAKITRNPSYLHVICKLLADATVLMQLIIMLWQNWGVNKTILIQWKCETPIMVLCWPLACIFWLGVAVLLLYTMAKEVSFRNMQTGDLLQWHEAFLFPYTLNMPRDRRWRQADWSSLDPRRWRTGSRVRSGAAQSDNDETQNDEDIGMSAELNQNTPRQSSDADTAEQLGIRIDVQMPENSLIANWQMYDFVVDFLGVAIYFYATFVLLSVLFLGSVRALKYASMVTGLYVGVRVVGTVF